MFKSLWFNLVATKDRDRQILLALLDCPMTAPMLQKQLGYEIFTTTMWRLERKGFVVAYWDEVRLHKRGGMRQRFYRFAGNPS